MAARSRRAGGGRPAPTPRLLGVLLCYNDGDLVEEAVRYLREQGHDLIVWDHGSTDETPDVLRSLEAELWSCTTVPRSVDFYQLYQAMSEHLLDNYVDRYDWVSWPDQDEFLEGPDRSRPYREWLYEVASSPYDWIQFNNFNFWWTAADDVGAGVVAERVRHYSLFPTARPASGAGGPRPPTSGSSTTTRPKASATLGFSTCGTTRCAARRRCDGAWRWTGRGCAGAGAITTTTT